MYRITRGNTMTHTALFAGIGMLSMIALASLNTPTAHALDLGSLDVNLPLGKVGDPVTKILNPITEALPLPISIDSTPRTLSADLGLPSLNSTPTDTSPSVNLDVTLPEAVPALTEPLSKVTDPVLDPVASAAQPLVKPLGNNVVRPLTQTLVPTSSTARSQRTPARLVTTSAPAAPVQLAVATNTSSAHTTLAVTGADPTPQPSPASDSPFSSVASFFASTLPNALSRFASGIVGKEINTLPIIISSIIFFLTMVLVGTIFYASNYGGQLVVGRYNLTKFAQAHDIAELATFVIVTVSFGFVAIFLSLTIL